MKLFKDQLKGLVPFSLWGPDHCGTNDDAKRHLMALFPNEEAFATPKPEALLERIIHIASDPGDLVADFFAGSATTAATAHKMHRRWIAIERSESVVRQYAFPRLCMVLAGKDPGGVTDLVGWRGGGSFTVLQVSPSIHERPLLPAGTKTEASLGIDLQSLGGSLGSTARDRMPNLDVDKPRQLSLDSEAS